MPQFTLHKNKNPRTRTTYPYVLDLQSDLLRDLHTRVVAPLAKAPALAKRPIRDLTPVVDVDGQKFVVLIPQLAGVSKSEIGAPVGVLTERRDEIIAAIDLLITGI